MTPWIIQSVEFSRAEYWNRYSFPPPGDLPNPEIEPRSSAFQVDSLLSEPPGYCHKEESKLLGYRRDYCKRGEPEIWGTVGSRVTHVGLLFSFLLLVQSLLQITIVETMVGKT